MLQRKSKICSNYKNYLTNGTKYDIIKKIYKGEKIRGIRKGGENQVPSIEKILLKMKRQPNGIRFQELQRVLEYNGYKMKTKTRNISQAIYK